MELGRREVGSEEVEGRYRGGGGEKRGSKVIARKYRGVWDIEGVKR